MICIGPEDYVYFTEVIGARVQRYSPENRWAGQLGQWGVRLGSFYRPKGIAVDTQGDLYIGDTTLNVIQVFEAWGTVKGVLTRSDGTPFRFAHPMGLWFDTRGRLYIVEMKANRVARLTLANLSEAVDVP